MKESKTDIKIINLAELNSNHFQYCRGIETISRPIGSPDHYYSGVFQPKKNISNTSVSYEVTVSKTDGSNNYVLIDKFDNHLLELVHTHLINEDCSTDVNMDDFLNYQIVPKVRDFFVKLLSNYCDFKNYPAVGIQWTKVNNYSSTFDKTQNRFRGLHIDSWGVSNMRIHERANAGMRACFNVGTSSRKISIVPTSLSMMANEINKNAGKELDFFEMPAAYVAEKYMSLNKELEVIQIDLPPGYFAIIPVQNIIHDGFLGEMKVDDLNLMICSDCMSIREDLHEFH